MDGSNPDVKIDLPEISGLWLLALPTGDNPPPGDRFRAVVLALKPPARPHEARVSFEFVGVFTAGIGTLTQKN